MANSIYRVIFPTLQLNATHVPGHFLKHKYAKMIPNMKFISIQSSSVQSARCGLHQESPSRENPRMTRYRVGEKSWSNRWNLWLFLNDINVYYLIYGLVAWMVDSCGYVFIYIYTHMQCIYLHGWWLMVDWSIPEKRRLSLLLQVPITLYNPQVPITRCLDLLMKYILIKAVFYGMSIQKKVDLDFQEGYINLVKLELPHTSWAPKRWRFGRDFSPYIFQGNLGWWNIIIP